MDVDLARARAFVAEYLDGDPASVEAVGAGAWSRAFGFRSGDDDLVVRFGPYVDDFACDRWAHAYASPELPIPEVRDLGSAFGGYYAVSTRVRGAPLESLGAAAWRAVVPSLADALEAMRRADLSATEGVGGWIGEGRAQRARWSDHLLAVGDDTPERRTHGWRERLAASPREDELFSRGFELLARVARDAVPRSLVHADLINRNALVRGGRISGVFDWGCALFGDHLYDLAWFEFWAPWHPELDVPALRSELERRWREVGYAPEDRDARMLACHLHIGLDHLAYNAWLDDRAALAATAQRLRTLALPLAERY